MLLLYLLQGSALEWAHGGGQARVTVGEDVQSASAASTTRANALSAVYSRSPGTVRVANAGSHAVSDGLPVAEELVVLVVAAVAASELGVVGDELDSLDPFHLFEAELDLVAES
jgi:hypothetical protein